MIEKARRETRFQARTARIDSTVIEADVRYPSDAMLALQGTRALAREGAKLSALIKGQGVRVIDRSRSLGRTVRAISRTLSRRTGEAKARVIELNYRAGKQIARSAREARKPTEFGYVAQLCEVTENTRRGARGFILPASHTPGNPAENRLLGATAAELERAGSTPREIVADGGFQPGPTLEALSDR